MQTARRLSLHLRSSASHFTLSRRELIKTSNLVRGSNIHWRASSSAASVPSDDSKIQIIRRRASKDERKAMVESFVNNYRAANAGRFPTASHTREQVGGSYYIVRNILQELECKSKTSPVSMSNERLGKEVTKKAELAIETKKAELAIEVEDVSSDQITVDAGTGEDVRAASDMNEVKIFNSDLKHQKKESQTSIIGNKTLVKEIQKPATADDNSNYFTAQNHMLKGEAKKEFHPSPEKLKEDVKEGTCEDELDHDDLNSDAKQHQQFPRDLSGKQTVDDQLPEKKSVLGSLRSLAYEVINMWRKL